VAGVTVTPVAETKTTGHIGVMARPSVRSHLVESALLEFHARGFHNCSVEDITTAAGVPKGSFYNHFASKDALAIEALRQYQARSVWRTTDDGELPPLTRLRNRYLAMRDVLVERGYTRGCLIGNMGTELADLNPGVRAEVQASLDFRTAASAALLREAQQRGDLGPQHDPEVLGRFLVDAWEGVVLRTKVNKSAEAIDGFFSILDQLLGDTSS
jgi:TetR/AcrR family transcriptional regulator, transcriptional repressor for nem operon